MVKLISYNIEYCEGMPGKWYQYLKFWKIFWPPPKLDDNIIKSLKRLKPDILTLIEVDTGSFRSRGRDEVKYFEEQLGMQSFAEKVKYPLTGWLKLFHHTPILNKQANAIISKYKFEDVKYHVFHEGTKRMIIEVTVRCPKPVTLLAAHLALGTKTRAKQIEELVGIVNNIKNPVLLMGDFNTFHGVGELKKLLKHTHLRDMIKLNKKAAQFTEPAYHPSKRLDYILASSEINVKSYTTLDFHFSDHLPVMIEFDLKKSRKNATKRKTTSQKLSKKRKKK